VSRRGLAVLLAAAASLAAGCGASTANKQSGLAWVGTPQVFRSKALPDDRIVVAHVRNAGKRTLHLVASNLVVRDADGHRLKGASAGFTNTFAHGLFGAYQQPDQVPPAELLRLGKAIYLPAGATAPFYAAWHLSPGTHGPIRIDYGAGSLTVPEVAVRPAAS
jgi:hypothetical protein